MDEHHWLAEQFEAHRGRLRAAAYRMLGSLGEADDAVQETWVRLSRSDGSGVESLARWLTTVVAECDWTCCTGASHSRREEPLV